MRLLIVIFLIILTGCYNCRQHPQKLYFSEIEADTTVKSLEAAYHDWLIQYMEWEKEMDSLIAVQNKSKVQSKTKSEVEESEKFKICEERGHVKPNVVQKTLIHCNPYLLESDTATILVYPACNWITYRCLRCGKWIEEKEKEQRIVLWEKGK